MKKLPKEKRNQVILVWLIIIGLISAWVFVVLKYQLDSKHRAAQNLVKRIDQFKAMTDQLERKDKIQADMDVAQQRLESLEYGMADGDVFSWAVNTLRDFKQSRNVDLPQISQPSITKNTLLPGFPYDQALVTVAGTAYFHDLGMFIADFENEFAFARICNVDIQPVSGGNEKLSFKMDIIFLVKPETNGSRS